MRNLLQARHEYLSNDSSHSTETHKCMDQQEWTMATLLLAFVVAKHESHFSHFLPAVDETKNRM